MSDGEINSEAKRSASDEHRRASDEHRRLIRHKARMAVTKVVATVFGLGIAIEIIGLLFGFFSLKQIVVDSAVPVLGAALFLMLLASERWGSLAPWMLVIAMFIEPILVPASGPLVMFDAVLPLTLILLLLARRRTVRRLEHELGRRLGAAEDTPAQQ